MQRYGGLGLKTKILPFSSIVCCDWKPDLRQRGSRAFFFVGRNEKRPARSEPLVCWVTRVTRVTCHIYFLNRWGMNSWRPRRQVRNSWPVPADSDASTLMPSSRKLSTMGWLLIKSSEPQFM